MTAGRRAERFSLTFREIKLSRELDKIDTVLIFVRQYMDLKALHR